MKRENKKKSFEKDILKHMHAMTALCVRFAGERSSQPGPAVHIGTIAPIVYAASIWTMNQATGWLIAAASWNQSPYGSESMENGR